MAGKKNPVMGLQTAAALSGSPAPKAAQTNEVQVKSADPDTVRAALKKVKQRDAELLKRLAR